MNNKALDHNASNQLNQPLTALAKTKTFMWVQSKVSRQIKHVHLWKLDKVVTIRKLVTTAQSEITSEFEFIQKRCKTKTNDCDSLQLLIHFTTHTRPCSRIPQNGG